MTQVSYDAAACEQAAQKFIPLIGPHAGIAMDFDDSLICSEIVTAWVTLKLLEPLVPSHLADQLTLKWIATHYSGHKFNEQLSLARDHFQIEGDFPPEIADQKSLGNRRALKVAAQVLPGGDDFLQFLLDFKFKAGVLTASEKDRVDDCNVATGLDKYLTTTGEKGKIPVFSTSQKVVWKGREYTLPSKSAPNGYEGYQFMADMLGLPRSAVVPMEDSGVGVTAADNGGFPKVGIVSLSRRCRLIDNHAESMAKLVKHSDFFVINKNWYPAARALVEIGFAHARAAGVVGLPDAIPDEVDQYLHARFSTVRAEMSPLPELQLLQLQIR